MNNFTFGACIEIAKKGTLQPNLSHKPKVISTFPQGIKPQGKYFLVIDNRYTYDAEHNETANTTESLYIYLEKNPGDYGSVETIALVLRPGELGVFENLPSEALAYIEAQNSSDAAVWRMMYAWSLPIY